jgi:GTP-binding protein
MTDPLPIRQLEFLGGLASTGGWRPEGGLPEVAFSGRSNVGKSSLINRLTRRKALARVSNTPGRTREIHFFQINARFALVDLPGYGYAKISKARQAEWRPLIEGYLRASALRRTSRLMSDDLPTFERPLNATSGSDGSGRHPPAAAIGPR